jgi:hypothetical protein
MKKIEGPFTFGRIALAAFTTTLLAPVENNLKNSLRISTPIVEQYRESFPNNGIIFNFAEEDHQPGNNRPFTPIPADLPTGSVIPEEKRLRIK